MYPDAYARTGFRVSTTPCSGSRESAFGPTDRRILGFSLGWRHSEGPVDHGDAVKQLALSNVFNDDRLRGKHMSDTGRITLEVSFDANVHSAQSLTRACYSLSDLGVFRIESGTQRHSVVCTTASDQGVVEDLLRAAAVDFAVRESIEARTRGLRDLIWKTAFAEARGTGPE